MNSFLYRKVLTPRKLKLDYISPPICEGEFSATGTSEISLQPIYRKTGPTGLIMDWRGTYWRLRWNSYPGALCYSVYKLSFSEYILVAECIDDPFIDLDVFGNGTYIVTVITDDGESDPSDPIPTPGEPPPPPGPGEPCDTSGVETPCSLMIPEDTLIATLTPDPFVATHTDDFIGSAPQGMYTISYDGGAWQDDDNPCPGSFKIASIKELWNGGIDEQDPLLGAGSFCGTQAEVEASMNSLGLPLNTFIHDSGSISIQYIRFGSATNPVPGAPNPTWTCKRIGTWPSFPNSVRIQDFGSMSWGTPCVDASNSGLPAWDGTLDGRTIFLPFLFQWYSSNEFNMSLDGKLVGQARVDWYASNPYTATGCGWIFWISFWDGSDLIDGWTGIKNVGTSPVGWYRRESGCLTQPECIYLEEY